MESLVLTRPIRSKRITQGWGDNKACLLPNGRIIGTSGKCPKGTEPFYASMGLDGHNGYDVAAIHGEMVAHCATFDGWMKIEKDMQGGIGVDIISKEQVQLHDGSESYIKVRYWHLKMPIGWDGKDVVYGMPIGLADNTGASSGDHLHWSVKKCDKEGKSTDKYNGYYGAFDQTPYYTHGIFAGDSARYLKVGSPLTFQEQQEIKSQLTLMRRILLNLRELLYKL